MSRKRKLLVAVLLGVLVIGGMIVGQLDIARRSIEFDLHSIGKSIYEARTKNGQWPSRIEDLAGTEYLMYPYRRGILESGQFVILWHQDLDPVPQVNRGRVLAYDNTSLLSRFGWVLVCRGDLHVEYMDAGELHRRIKAMKE